MISSRLRCSLRATSFHLEAIYHHHFPSQPFNFVNLSTSLRPPLNPSFYPYTQSSSALALVHLSSTILLLVVATLVLLLQAVHRTQDTGKFHCSRTAYCKPNVKSPLSPSFTFYVLRRLSSLTSFLPTHPRNPSHLLVKTSNISILISPSSPSMNLTAAFLALN